MKKIVTTLAAAGLASVIMTGQSTQAKADGGAVVIGIGAYLLIDAIVGRHCQRDEWPFNTFRKVDDELHGRHGCYPHRHRHYHHRKHHSHY